MTDCRCGQKTCDICCPEQKINEGGRRKAKTSKKSWIDAYVQPPATNMLQEELIEVKGVCAWGSDGFHHTYCNFKITHWRPL